MKRDDTGTPVDCVEQGSNVGKTDERFGASRDRREIDLRLVQVNGHAVIEVTDYGLGIPPAEQGRIFDRFYRASTAATIGGTGLGLSIVKSIAEAHGGSLDVQSEAGSGTAFTFRLPVS